MIKVFNGMNRVYFVAVLLLACSTENPATDAGTDASVDAAPVDASTDSGNDAAPSSCSGFVTDAGAIQQMFVASDTPVGDGGVLVDGIYDVTAWAVYTGADGGAGPTGMTVQATQVIEAGTYGYDERWTLGDAGGVLDTSGTIGTLDGGGLTGGQKCPTGPQPFTTYSTDGTNVTFFGANPPWGLTLKRR